MDWTLEININSIFFDLPNESKQKNCNNIKNYNLFSASAHKMTDKLAPSNI